jgi:serine/threonine-protein kinase HipA
MNTFFLYVHHEYTIRDNLASYLDIAECISNHGPNVKANLNQLWRRIIFNIAIFNTDDHLKNHCFILIATAWISFPACDPNPLMDKEDLSLNLNIDNNALDFELAKSVELYFRLSEDQMDKIIQEVLQVAKKWKIVAKKFEFLEANKN